MSQRIRLGINGLGRIGKCILRAYFEYFDEYGDKLEIVAINTGSGTIEDRLHGLKYDSTHGNFKQKIQILSPNAFSIDNKSPITMLFERDLSKVDWNALGVDVVLECTGALVNGRGAHVHLQAGAKKVIVSAPYEEADEIIVIGANEHKFQGLDVISIGSCTTNALVPVVKILNNEFGIESGFMTTIHAYTNDQLILDGSHKDQRRARAAALSAIPSTTGAAKSIGLVLPELQGKLDGSAVRVPIANVSMIDLKFTTLYDIDSNMINEIMRRNAIKNVLAITNEQLVSCDFNHTRYSAIFDQTLTKVVNKRFGRVVAWYDNEWGFSNRMLDMAVMFFNNGI